MKTNRPSLRTKCRRPLLAAPRILPCPPKMSLRTSPQTGVAIRTPRAPHFLSRVGGGDCPPSCQPIPAHCRGRQSGHFLETGSLLPPPAALRRFPRRPADNAPHLHKNPVIARSVATWQSVPPTHRTPSPCVGAGFYPARPLLPIPIKNRQRRKSHRCRFPFVFIFLLRRTPFPAPASGRR